MAPLAPSGSSQVAPSASLAAVSTPQSFPLTWSLPATTGANMVTTGPRHTNETLKNILSASTQRWDLLDKRKRDAWLLRTRSAL